MWDHASLWESNIGSFLSIHSCSLCAISCDANNAVSVFQTASLVCIVQRVYMSSRVRCANVRQTPDARAKYSTVSSCRITSLITCMTRIILLQASRSHGRWSLFGWQACRWVCTVSRKIACKECFIGLSLWISRSAFRRLRESQRNSNTFI